jgi:hypothetical protein
MHLPKWAYRQSRWSAALTAPTVMTAGTRPGEKPHALLPPDAPCDGSPDTATAVTPSAISAVTALSTAGDAWYQSSISATAGLPSAWSAMIHSMAATKPVVSDTPSVHGMILTGVSATFFATP